MSYWKLEEKKTESQRRKCEQEALNSLRQGDTHSAKQYADKADKIGGTAKVDVPNGAWQVRIVANTPQNKRKDNSDKKTSK